MNKTVVLLLLLLIGFISCKTAEKEIDKLELAKKYYTILNNSDDAEIAALLTDSLITRETEYDYEQTFTLKEYVEWVKWDAVFEPTYKILEIEQEGETVKAKISKMDTRIQFLHEGPIVTNQVLRFNKDKITTVETTNYEIFNDSIFVKNREEFLGWIDQNHPELDGFIYDQTKTGGLKYLKAMEQYKSSK